MDFFNCVDLISSFTLIFVMAYIGRSMSLQAPPSPSVKVVYVVVASAEGAAMEEGLALPLPVDETDEDWVEVNWSNLFIYSLLACLLALTMCMARVLFILYMISRELELQQLTLMHVIENM
jgi:hypothetical protein